MKTLPASINSLLKNKDEEALKEVLNALSPFEIAELISNKSEKEKAFIFNCLSIDLQVQTFDFLPVRQQKWILQNIHTMQSALLLSSLSPDDRTSFLQELPSEVIEEFIKLLPESERLLTSTLLGHPEGSIGRLMTPDYIAVKLDWTIENVLDHIQDYGHDSETIDFIYVVNDDGKLLDDIKLKEFLFISRQAKVENICDCQFLALSVNEKDETAIATFRESDRAALPVIDEQGKLLGIVTIDDILRLTDQEATEDIQKIGGMEALDEPYMQAPFFELMKKRAGWLIILFVGEMLTATALGYFQDEIARAVVLALFLPLIISSGGNAGSQASTLVIRAMALGEVKLRNWWQVLVKEFSSGIFLGIVLGFIGFCRIFFWTFFTDIYGDHWFLLALAVSLSLVGVVLWGTLTGSLLPLLLRRIGVDPATASVPCVATMVDVTGVVIYFMISIAILKGTLL